MENNQESKQENTIFISLKDGEYITGNFHSFGKNKYGLFITLTNSKEKWAVNINATVLRNLIKVNIEKVKVGSLITIRRVGKVENKNYVLYQLFIDGIEQTSKNQQLTFDEFKNIL